MLSYPHTIALARRSLLLTKLFLMECLLWSNSLHYLLNIIVLLDFAVVWIINSTWSQPGVYRTSLDFIADKSKPHRELDCRKTKIELLMNVLFESRRISVCCLLLFTRRCRNLREEVEQDTLIQPDWVGERKGAFLMVWYIPGISQQWACGSINKLRKKDFWTFKITLLDLPHPANLLPS